MLLASNIKLALLAAAGFAAPLAMTADLPVEVDQPGGDRPALVELQPGTARYRRPAISPAPASPRRPR